MGQRKNGLLHNPSINHGKYTPANECEGETKKESKRKFAVCVCVCGKGKEKKENYLKRERVKER